MPCSDLHIPERDSGVKGGHDEGRSQHVRVDSPEPSALANRTDPPVSGPAVQALAVAPTKDRSLVALSDGEIDRAGGSRHE